MATTGRPENTALARWPIAELLEAEPYLFEFFQAIRLMSRMAPERQLVGRFTNPASEVVRLASHTGVAFPASEIQSLERTGGAPPVMRVNFLGLHSRSATGLRQVLWDYFDVPVEIEQFVGAWYPVELESQCCLGETGGYSEQLGFGAVVGDETWDQQSRVRIQLGPLSLEEYVDFLPGHEGHRELRALTQFYTGGECVVEVQLILR